VSGSDIAIANCNGFLSHLFQIYIDILILFEMEYNLFNRICHPKVCAVKPTSTNKIN